VITLDWDKAAQWSQMLIGKADALVPGYLLPPELEIEEDINNSFLEKDYGTVSDLDAAEIVKRFRMTTSPLGRELAGLLAASPVINLPVVRLIQESLLPKSNQVQVAEVFLGGLLRPQSVSLEKLQSQESESKTILSPDSVEYEFIQPEIRDIFLDDAPISDSIDVVNAVSRYVAEQLGVSLSEFMAVLKAPQQAEEKQREDTIKPFAQITARVLRKLGGQYVQFAEELEQPVDKTISNTSEQKEIEQDISLSDELRTAMTIADEQEQAEVLSHLMARSPEAPSNLLNSLSTIEDETDRVSALIALVAHLPHSLLPNALEIVRNLQHTLSRFQGLAILATLLPEVVPEALQAALNITNESTLLRALTSLVEKLPVELLPQALQASLTIDDAFSRTRALIALVDKLPEAAPQALEAILSIESEDSRARALRELVPHLPVSFLPYTLEVVMAIQQENVRNDLLKDLRSFLPENLWHQPNVVAATSSRTPLWQEGDTQIYTLCTSTPWDLPLDVLVIPVGNRGGLGNFAVAFQEFLGIKPKWLTQVISNLIEAKKLKRIKPDQPLLVQIPFEINSQISSLVGFTSERFIICATSESENELSSNNTSIAYEAVVRLAVEQGFKRIVLPLIGTGVNRLPVDEVAEGMLRAINNVLKSHRSTSLEEITIVDRSADKIEIINRITHRLKEIDSFDNLESVIRNDSPENTLDNQSAQQNQPEKGENIKLLNTLIGHKDIILRMAWSPDGRFLASPSVDHTIRVWKPLDNQSSLILEGHNHGVNHVAWSPDGKTLASVSFDKTMRIWDVSTGNCLYTIEAHSEDIGTIAWSPGGRVLASGSVDTTIKLWDINTRQSLVTFQGHTKDVTRVSWSPDGQILASCSQDGTIRLWDTNTYKIRQTIKKSMNTGGIICISWSPNQKLLASASYRSIEIWSFNSQGEMVLKNQLKKLGSKYVSCVSFSPDGRLLASKEMDNRIRLFSCETWQEVKNFNEPSSSFWPVSLSFHPTQNILATLGQKDRVIRIWKLNINDLLDR
jgi:WD40 repeat protein